MAEKLLIWLTKRGGMNTLKILSEHLTKVNNAIHEFKKLLENMSEGKDKEADENMSKIFLIEEGCDHLARNIAREIQKGKLPPIDREDTLQLLWRHEKIIDLTKDAALILKLIKLDAKERIPKELLKKLMLTHPAASNKLRNSKLSQTNFHCLTLGGPIPKFYSNGFLAVGDVASQVKPTTGGGVILGMTCAKIAAEV
ncbi:MAG: DUF47 family protein, partial [Candidatus Bathyarchaeia archaeon]